MEDTEAKIYSEVYALVQLAGEDYKNMLPDKVKKSIEAKRDKTYTPVYSINIPLEKQNIKKESLAILANIEYNYWCKTENEKKEFINELKQIDINSEKKLRELYNPDNIFKNNRNLKDENKNEDEDKNAALTEIKKDTFIGKVYKFFYKLFDKIIRR